MDKNGEIKEVAMNVEYSSRLHVKCLYCNMGSMEIGEIMYRLPALGRVLIVTKRCSRCGYRHVDIIPVEKKPRVRIYYRVESNDDLYTKVVRSNRASMEILEYGARMEPGIMAPTFITNIEGLLNRFLDAVRSLEVLETDEEEKRKARGFEETILKLRDNAGFTLIIDDPLGVSRLIPHSEQRGKIIIEYVEGDLG